MRAFVAVEIPEEMRAALVDLQAGLPGRHVPEENLHLTLAFLGEVSDAKIFDIAEGLADLRLEAPDLVVTALDIFGGRKPALVFATVSPSPALETARQAVGACCRRAGVSLRRERFRPHVTLSRFGRQFGDREARLLAGHLGPVAPIMAEAEGFAIYRSVLGPGGPNYGALAAFAFA